jgi:hypothetical protein
MRSVVGVSLVGLSSALVAVVLSACGSGGGGGKTTTINGRVENIVQVQLEHEGPPRVARHDHSTLWGFLGVAYAQTSGLVVDAVVNGEIVDSDTVDSGGRFELRVDDENLTEDVKIVFNTAPILELDILTIEESDVSLVVSLFPVAGDIVVSTFQIETRDLSCEGDGTFSYVEPQVTTMTIDGDDGKECIRARDECQFIINIGGRLNVQNCDDGVVAEDDSEVRLTPGTMSSLNIIAGRNGIRAANNASIVATGFDVDIAGREYGISAKNNAFVQVSVPIIGTCDIDGGRGAVDSNNAAIVDIGECRTI